MKACVRWKNARWSVGARITKLNQTGYVNAAPKAITTAMTWIHSTTS